MRFEVDQVRMVRAPSTVARWATAQAVSHIISGVISVVMASIAAGGISAIALAIGATNRGRTPPPSIDLILGISLGAAFGAAVLIESYREMRNLTRPSPVELPSGRSSPLYDRELDG